MVTHSYFHNTCDSCIHTHTGVVKGKPARGPLLVRGHFRVKTDRDRSVGLCLIRFHTLVWSGVPSSIIRESQKACSATVHVDNYVTVS